MTDSCVSCESDGHVALITFNRPDAMNAFNVQMRTEFADAQAKIEADDAIRIVVVTGSGRAFSAGTDLKEMDVTANSYGAFDNSIRDYKPLIDGIAHSNKIYISAINGFAGGVALGMALGSDLAVMADNATVFSPFANIGLVPDGGASYQLFHAMGYKRAFAAIAECERLNAQQCLDLGLINKIAPADSLVADTKAWAHSLAERAPLALRNTKKILQGLPGLNREQAAYLESEYQMQCVNSEDSAAAVQAFLSKEKPVFKGR